MNTEVRFNIIACIFIFLAIVFVIILINFDKKVKEDILNSQSYKNEAEGATEVFEEVWKKTHKLETVTIIFVILGMISLAYLGLRYIGIPIIKEHLQFLFKFLEKWIKKQ